MIEHRIQSSKQRVTSHRIVPTQAPKNCSGETQRLNVRGSNNQQNPKQYLYLTNKIQRENNAMINNQLDLASSGLVQFGMDKVINNSSSMVALSKFKNQTRG